MLEDYNLEPAVQPVLTWYQQKKRSLPWRQDLSPYRVWVSEIMLQQTRAETVKPYFIRFLRELPDIPSLADCPEERLLKLWEGLGYYNRVRSMQKAARIIMETYHGVFPADYETIKSLPGIGNYTAGAVASIAFGICAPAVDGNVLRILMRLTDDPSDIAKQSVKTRAEQALRPVMPKDCPGTFNQALMELGALVCIPNGAPQCGTCPWEGICLAHCNGREELLPVKKKAKPRRIEERTVLLICAGNSVLLNRRPDHGLLAGLYEFPNVKGYLNEAEALQTAAGLGLFPVSIQRLPDAIHVFSHVEWHMQGYQIYVTEPIETSSGLLFAVRSDMKKKYALPAAFGAYAGILEIR